VGGAAGVLLLVLASLGVALALAELGLRLWGFRFEIGLKEIGFGAQPGTLKLMQRHRRLDPDLFWLPERHREKLARLAQRRADLVFLGDSCTELGRYPEQVLAGLRRRFPERRISGLVLASSGWSSFQGLQLLRRDVAPLRPRVVTLYFGWNDHWMGYGFEDRHIHAMTTAPPEALRQLRLSQLLFKAVLAQAVSRRERWPNRVPAERYRENLREMVALVRGAQGIPLLITAPTSHRVGAEPPHLARHWILDLSQLVPVHRHYLEITREVARDTEAPLCDLAADFDALLAREPASRYFESDGIHLSEAGDRRIADRLIGCLQATQALRAVWGSAQGR
jgi:lysophospholipase L1-like esterase